MKKQITNLIKVFGWLQIESNNPYMVSFFHEAKKYRINYYFTTGTLTIDFKEGRLGVHKNISLETLENILQNA